MDERLEVALAMLWALSGAIAILRWKFTEREVSLLDVVIGLFLVLQHGPGQEDAPWPYEAQLYFARRIEAEARRDALEGAAQLVEKATYRKRWAKAAVNSQASNVPPCELAAAIRKLKEDIQ